MRQIKNKNGYYVKMTYDETSNTFKKYETEACIRTDDIGRLRCENNYECMVYVESLSQVSDFEMQKHILESFKYSTMLLEKVKQQKEDELKDTINTINKKKDIIKKLSYLEREQKLNRIINDR